MSIPRSYRRLLTLLLALPVALLMMALIYQAGMTHLEERPRSLGESIEWAAETLTTTGYGRDAHWSHPVMEAYVIAAQFSGLLMVFLVFPVFVLPFFEERFQGRLPARLPRLAGKVLIYRYGPAVTSLLEELSQAGVQAVILEEDEPTARRLLDRNHKVVLANADEEEVDLSPLVGARGLVVNGDDDANAAMTLSARYQGFQGTIAALVANPIRRPPMLRAGANIAFTPNHVLAAALAARASVRISPRVAGVRRLGHHLEVAELRVTRASPLAGKTIAESAIRARTGAIVVGLWVRDRLVRQPGTTTRIDPGAIIVAVGSQSSIARLGELATPVPRQGPFVILGHGDVGSRVAVFLRDAGEVVTVVDAEPGSTVDLVGDPLNLQTLERAGAREAQAVILTFDRDSATLFAAAVVRDLAPEAVIIAGASRVENVARIHRAGADFALSVGQVAGQFLAYHLLGQESVSLEAGIKLMATAPGSLAGQPLVTGRIRERTGCSVVAVERGEEVIVEFPEGFALQEGDAVYLSGTNETLAEYFRHFPDTRVSPVAREPTPLVDGEAADRAP
ncbi:MAG: TrkA family potassium uptake protein [Gemmatimonadales bacterium]